MNYNTANTKYWGISVMELNYAGIGKRIRKFRLEKGYTQEMLAANSGISTVHISHIEGGHTKAGLPKIVSIANALKVSVDMLLQDSLIHIPHVSVSEIERTLSDCSPAELKILSEILQAGKLAFRRHSEEYFTEKFSDSD
jgi:transcriptional regulator with XRE-family HTH domain